MKKKKLWYDYLWIWTIIYFALSFFNILFAWFGMLDFLLPLGIAIFGGNKTPTKGARGLVNLGFALTGAGAETLVPLGIAIFGGNKFFCNHLCGRGQLFSKLGGDLKCSRNKPTPRWMSSK